MKKLTPIAAQHLLQLFDKQIISDEELMPYFVKDGKISMDPNVLTDLREIAYNAFQGIAGYNVAPSLHVENARQVALQLHDKGLVTREQIREFFQIGVEVSCGCSGFCHQMPTVTINGI